MRTKSIRFLLAGLVLTALPMSSFAFVSVGLSINIAPPALPVYVQPPCPVVGYIWTPGYWAYDEDGGYYWVPGTWVAPPEPGFLWTPGYWGWVGGAYIWHAGYWGPHVGFYGGVNYGFGYGGVGFEGGYWRGGAFYYNSAVSNLGGVHVTNVYNRTVINNVTVVNRVSYNGGTGGLTARPTAGELAAEHDHHVAFTPAQTQHEHLASTNHDLRASVNGGKPRIAATERAAVFSGHGVVAARAAGGPVHSVESHAAATHGNESHGGASQAGQPHGSPSHFAQSHNEPQVRTDRPPGATGSSGGGRPQGAAAHVQNLQHESPSHGGSAEPRMQTHAEPHNQPHYQAQAQPHSETHFQSQPRSEAHYQPQQHSEPHYQPQPHNEPRSQPQGQPHGQPQGRGEPRHGEPHR